MLALRLMLLIMHALNLICQHNLPGASDCSLVQAVYTLVAIACSTCACTNPRHAHAPCAIASRLDITDIEKEGILSMSSYKGEHSKCC